MLFEGQDSEEDKNYAWEGYIYIFQIWEEKVGNGSNMISGEEGGFPLINKLIEFEFSFKFYAWKE